MAPSTPPPQSPQQPDNAPKPAPGQAPSKTILGRLSQMAQKVSRVHFSQLRLNPDAKPPKLMVHDPTARQRKEYALLGEYYLVGRSSDMDITVANPIVSTEHLSLRKVPGWFRPVFVLQDRKSTNGIFIGKKRINGAVLGHGDTVTLGPSDLAEAVQVEYVDPPPMWLKVLRYGAYGIGGAIALATAIILWEWQSIQVIPLPQGVRGPVVITAGDGRTPVQPPLTTTHRELKSVGEYGKYLPKALIASEDARFNWHFGVDPIGVLRAAVVNIQAGDVQQGASTITQQVARSIYPEYVGRENSAERKLREAMVALKLETYYGKDKILLTYLNQVFLGNGLYGFEDAAQFYFGKSAGQLDLSEAATLVGILPAPNRWNPVVNYKKALERRNLVIQRMISEGYISLEEANRARRSRVRVSPKAEETLRSNVAPYFYSYVFQELEELLGPSLAREGNFAIETSLNLNLQKASDRSLRESIAGDGARFGFSQGAVVTLDGNTGAVVAMSGGKDFKESQFNRAVQAQRQPGSTFKTFAYLAALNQGIPAGRSFSCAPVTWMGQRYRGCRGGGGSLTMVPGVARSENPIALRVAEAAGIDAVIDQAKTMGIKSELRRSPGLILGESETNLLELTGAYGILANGGRFNKPHAINRIVDTSDCENFNDFSTCRVIYDYNLDESRRNEQVLDAGIAQTMTQLLRGTVAGGTGKSASVVPGAVGKTGTTDRNVDLLFVGYIPGTKLTAGVWLGNDDNSPTRGSSAQAATLWGKYLRQAQ
ncbi:MAG: transglycosylase domain-containing protein [Cyanobacteria bacterium P01_C01_bin.89]